MSKNPSCKVCAKRVYKGTSRISPRQAEYIRYVFKGLSIKEIAKKMFVTEKAVKWMVCSLNAKFKTKRRYEWLTRYVDSSHPPEIQAQLARITGLRFRPREGV